MTVENYYVEEKDITADKIDINNPSHADMLLYSILCNDSTNVDGNEIGDPTETALINLGEKYAYKMCIRDRLNCLSVEAVPSAILSPVSVLYIGALSLVFI